MPVDVGHELRDMNRLLKKIGDELRRGNDLTNKMVELYSIQVGLFEVNIRKSDDDES